MIGVEMVDMMSRSKVGRVGFFVCGGVVFCSRRYLLAFQRDTGRCPIKFCCFTFWIVSCTSERMWNLAIVVQCGLLALEVYNQQMILDIL